MRTLPQRCQTFFPSFSVSSLRLALFLALCLGPYAGIVACVCVVVVVAGYFRARCQFSICLHCTCVCSSPFCACAYSSRPALLLFLFHLPAMSYRRYIYTGVACALFVNLVWLFTHNLNAFTRTCLCVCVWCMAVNCIDMRMRIIRATHATIIERTAT